MRKPGGQKTALWGSKNRIIVYAGQYYDQETGLHYNYHRYYDPSIGRYLRADPLGLNRGMNHLYVYALNNPIVASDPRGLLTSREAFDHYLEGSRKPLRISFNDINTDKVYPELFPGFFELLKPLYKKNGSAAVDLKMAYSVPGSLGAVLGDITLRLEGEITSTTCNWKFKGTLKSYDDYYDFNPGNRGQLIETGIQMAREMDGAPYWIEIRGAKSISAGPFSWRWFKP